MSTADLSFSESPLSRRAKIVATLGPASNTEPVFRSLVQAGLDVVRLNFSHGAHEEKLALIQMIRKVSREENKLGILTAQQLVAQLGTGGIIP